MIPTEKLKQVSECAWRGTLWGGEALEKQEDHPLVSKEKGKGSEVRTSWFALKRERRVVRLRCSRRKEGEERGEGRLERPADAHQTGPLVFMWWASS